MLLPLPREDQGPARLRG